jgi:hypothetical protein
MLAIHAQESINDREMAHTVSLPNALVFTLHKGREQPRPLNRNSFELL